MRKLLVLAAVVALAMFAGSAMAQNSVVDTVHNFQGQGGGTTTQVCVYCHTPHQSESPYVDTDPLWNHTLSTVAAYGVYSSTTLNANPVTDLGGGTTVSNLCLSCHDGTVAISSVYKAPTDGTTGTIPALTSADSAYVGSDLTNDHPVNFTYDAALATADGGLVTPDSATSVDAAGNIPLFGATVQCASCHDPHDDFYAPFLVVSNADSNLCTSCHVK